MIKSGDNIERDFYTFWKHSKLASVIHGKIYREGSRPMNAQTEDAVIAFKTGLAGQYQDGEVVINVYVPNIEHDNIYQKDISRCLEIGDLIVEDVNTFTNAEYLVRLLTIPQSFEAEGVNQYFVNARIKFTRK